MPYNGSNTKQVRIAEKAAQRAELAKIDFLKRYPDGIAPFYWAGLVLGGDSIGKIRF